MKQINKKDLLLTISTAVKYLGTAVIILVGAISQKNSMLYLLCGLFEEIAVFALGEMLSGKNKFLGWLVSSLFLLIIFAQYAVLKLGGSFTSMIMVTNLHAAGALSGKSAIYISAVVLAVIIFFLPVREFLYGYRCKIKYLISGILSDALICSAVGIGFSPELSMGKLGQQLYSHARMETQIAAKAKESASSQPATMKPVADNGHKYPVKGQMPNVILIFTEGLSQNIVEDDRNIMPNVRKWEDSSIDFTNYFNHTAATFRGIYGQLHSGYQFNDLDRNGLMSLQDVLSEAGYETTFINPEPNVEDFTAYLKDMEFDHFVNGDGSGNVVSDRKMYDLMYRKLKTADKSKPQFLAMYTFGTHVSLDSPDQKYGDGTNRELNKFYNVDYQFGKFMNKLKKSSLSDNTIVVFTADHCTVKDSDFDNTFGNVYTRKAYFCDRVPLLFWYKGVTPEKIDVNGRNTLDMAPTLLDFLDIGQPDTFEGTSLFTNPTGEQLVKETTFDTPGQDQYFSTLGGDIRKLTDDEREKTNQMVVDYATKATAAWNAKKEKETEK